MIKGDLTRSFETVQNFIALPEDSLRVESYPEYKELIWGSALSLPQALGTLIAEKGTFYRGYEAADAMELRGKHDGWKFRAELIKFYEAPGDTIVTLKQHKTRWPNKGARQPELSVTFKHDVDDPEFHDDDAADRSNLSNLADLRLYLADYALYEDRVDLAVEQLTGITTTAAKLVRTFTKLI